MRHAAVLTGFCFSLRWPLGLHSNLNLNPTLKTYSLYLLFFFFMFILRPIFKKNHKIMYAYVFTDRVVFSPESISHYNSRCLFHLSLPFLSDCGESQYWTLYGHDSYAPLISDAFGCSFDYLDNGSALIGPLSVSDIVILPSFL